MQGTLQSGANKGMWQTTHCLEDGAFQELDGVGVILLLGLAIQLVYAVVAHLGQCQELGECLQHI